MANSQTFAVVGAARFFALLAIGSPILWLRQEEGLLALLALSAVWIYQGITATRRELEISLSPTTEAATVGVICALGMTSSPSLLAALVVPPLYATAVVGIRTEARLQVGARRERPEQQQDAQRARAGGKLLGFGLIGAAIHYAITPKAYQATAVIQIERRNMTPLGNGQNPWLENYWNLEFYPTQYELLPVGLELIPVAPGGP